jgi:cytochrome c oxidase assembly protein subunit 15
MTDYRTCSHDTGPRAAFTSGVKPVARLAWLIVAYNIAIILWGAYVRVSGSGAGCGSRWPLCNGEILPSGTQSQTLIEFVHRVTSALSLVIVSFLVVWCWRRTSKGEWARYSSLCGLFFLFNEALLGALLVLSDHVGLDPSAAHALFLCLHFGNTLLLLAALTLTARWLSNRERHFVVVRKPHERLAIGLGLVSVMAIGMTGSLASLGDTIFPAGSLWHALMQDFSSSSHMLLRLRLLHPVAAAIGSLYVLWLLWNLQGKRDWSALRLALGATLMAQIVLGLMNVIFLAPVWLQMTHLLVAELFWILVVLASAELLLVEQQQWSGLAGERTSEVTWGALKHMPGIQSSFMKIFEDGQKETLRAR